MSALPETRLPIVLLFAAALLVSVACAPEAPIEERSAAALVEQAFEEGGADAARATFDELLAAGEGRALFSEAEFNRLGYKFVRTCTIDDAVSVFEMATEVWPESANAWDSLGDGLRRRGDKDASLASYRRVLELEPGHENATWRIRLIDRSLTDFAAETQTTASHTPGEATGLFGPYLGQKPPGTTPELFAPGLVSMCSRFEYNPTFTPDGKEMYFSTDRGLMVSRLGEQGWTAPERAGFRGFEAQITADGSRMFLGRGREIWVLERDGDGWSEGEKVCDGMRPSVADDGTFYVTELTEGTDSFIAWLPADKVGKEEPTRLPASVNGEAGGAHPAISPDGRTLIFDSHRNGVGGAWDNDFFVTRRRDDGTWTTPRRFGEGINTPGENICATFSPDGRYLFYTANNDVYWVSAEVLQGE